MDLTWTNHPVGDVLAFSDEVNVSSLHRASYESIEVLCLYPDQNEALAVSDWFAGLGNTLNEIECLPEYSPPARKRRRWL